MAPLHFPETVPCAISFGMSEDGYLIAQIVFLICLLVLVVPALLGRGLTMPVIVRNIVIWIAIAAGVALIYHVWKG